MKRILSTTLIFLLAFSPVGYAHTGLTSSSPADGEDVAEDVHQIVLEFNTKIETTSTVKVFNENIEEMIINNTQVSDSVITAGFMSPLDNGTYTVEWKIIGADGHPITGTYSFTVNQVEIEDLEDTAVPEEPVETPTALIEELVDEPIKEPVEQAIEDSSKIASNDVLVVILVILFTIAGGFIGWIIGRRQK